MEAGNTWPVISHLATEIDADRLSDKIHILIAFDSGFTTYLCVIELCAIGPEWL